MPTRADIEAHLAELEHAFDQQEPTLEITVRQEDVGMEGYLVVWNLPSAWTLEITSISMNRPRTTATHTRRRRRGGSSSMSGCR